MLRARSTEPLWVGFGDQDFRQVVGGAELQGITPDQAIGRLVAHDLIDNVSSA
jgi:hypothetical protein